MSNRYGDHGYTIINEIDIIEWTRPHAVMPKDLWMQLVEEYGDPVIGRINDIHYQFTPEWGIPANKAVIPQSKAGGAERFLLQTER